MRDKSEALAQCEVKLEESVRSFDKEVQLKKSAEQALEEAKKKTNDQIEQNTQLFTLKSEVEKKLAACQEEIRVAEQKLSSKIDEVILISLCFLYPLFFSLFSFFLFFFFSFFSFFLFFFLFFFFSFFSFFLFFFFSFFLFFFFSFFLFFFFSFFSNSLICSIGFVKMQIGIWSLGKNRKVRAGLGEGTAKRQQAEVRNF